MELKRKTLITIVVGVLLLALIIYSCSCPPCEEGFKKCICTGALDCNCQDTDKVEQDYMNEKSTEFSNFVDKKWGTWSPGDINYPVETGCQNSQETKDSLGWFKWDFTDFGS